MSGNGMRRAEQDLSPAEVWLLDARARDDYQFELIALVLYIVLSGSIAFVPVLFKRSQLFGTLGRAAQFAILAACAGPAALIVPLATAAPGAWGPGVLAAALYLLFPLAALRTRTSAGRLAAACAVPAVVLLVDGITRGHLFRDALWGRMPIAGGRLYGIDNTCLGVLLGAGWIALGWIAERRGRFGRTLATWLTLLIALIIALPSFGANVGGAITAATAVGFRLTCSRTGRAEWTVREVVRGTLVSIGLAVALMVISLAMDSRRVLAPQSHLAAGVGSVAAGGLPVAWDIAVRKLWQNLSITLWLIGPATIALYPVVRTVRRDRRRLKQALACHPGLDASLRSLAPTMVAAYVFNDTGVVTDAFLVLYYLGALLYFWLGMPAHADGSRSGSESSADSAGSAAAATPGVSAVSG